MARTRRRMPSLSSTLVGVCQLGVVWQCPIGPKHAFFMKPNPIGNFSPKLNVVSRSYGCLYTSESELIIATAPQKKETGEGTLLSCLRRPTSYARRSHGHKLTTVTNIQPHELLLLLYTSTYQVNYNAKAFLLVLSFLMPPAHFPLEAQTLHLHALTACPTLIEFMLRAKNEPTIWRRNKHVL